MSMTQELEDTLQGPARKVTVRKRKRLRRDLVTWLLPNYSLSVPTALYVIQEARCFHCKGFMPLFYNKDEHCRPSREHALPAGVGPAWTFGVAHMRAAVVLAHKLCNAERAQRPLSRREWQRARDVWSAADALWLEADKGVSPFPIWIDLACRMQQEPT